MANPWSNQIYRNVEKHTGTFAKRYAIFNSYIFVPAYFGGCFVYGLLLYAFFSVPPIQLPLPYATL